MLLNLNYKFWLLITSKKTKKKRRKYLYYNFQINIWNIPVSLLQSHETLSLNDSHAHGLPAFSFFVSPRLSVTKILLPAFILEARRLPSIPLNSTFGYSLSFDDLTRQFHAPARFRPRWSKVYEIFDNRWDGFLFSSFNLRALYIDKRAIPVCVG